MAKCMVFLHFDVTSWICGGYLSSITFHIPAAMAAPMNGPMMKIQSCDSSSPPWNIAGPIERAGLTDVPV